MFSPESNDQMVYDIFLVNEQPFLVKVSKIMSGVAHGHELQCWDIIRVADYLIC